MHCAELGKNTSVFAVLSILIVLALSLLIGRLAALALTVTGVPRSIARFQARSALTGAGFTTTESEQIVGHPVRRRIVMVLMLAGNLGAAGLIASLIGGVVGINTFGGGVRRGVFLLAGLLLLFYVSKSAWADRRLSQFMLAILRRFTDLEVRDYAGMLHLSGDYAVSELFVKPNDWIAGTPLKELHLPREGVLVLGIVRADGGYLGAPTGESCAEAGDTLIVYGRGPVIEDLDRRHAGAEGEQAHEQAVAEQRVLDDAEATRDVVLPEDSESRR